MKVIVARDIVKYHGGDRKVLSGASLSVEAGEKIGLVGRNGAGKTTLLEILAGDSEADSGSVDRVGDAKVGMTSQSLYAGGRGRISIEQEIVSAFEPLMQRESGARDPALGGTFTCPPRALREAAGRVRAGRRLRLQGASCLHPLRPRLRPGGLEAPRGVFLGWRAEPHSPRAAPARGARPRPPR